MLLFHQVCILRKFCTHPVFTTLIPRLEWSMQVSYLDQNLKCTIKRSLRASRGRSYGTMHLVWYRPTHRVWIKPPQRVAGAHERRSQSAVLLLPGWTRPDVRRRNTKCVYGIRSFGGIVSLWQGGAGGVGWLQGQLYVAGRALLTRKDSDCLASRATDELSYSTTIVSLSRETVDSYIKNQHQCVVIMNYRSGAAVQSFSSSNSAKLTYHYAGTGKHTQLLRDSGSIIHVPTVLERVAPWRRTLARKFLIGTS